jgi:hypothetical protein
MTDKEQDTTAQVDTKTAPTQAEQPARASTFTLKDWVTLGISMLALAISGGSAYFNILRVEDRVSLIVEDGPVAFMTNDNNFSVYLDSEPNFIFINSGSRPAVIAWLRLFFLQSSGKAQKTCSSFLDGNEATFDTNFEPLVVKEREVVTKKIKMTDAAIESKMKKGSSGNFLFPVETAFIGETRITITVCAAVRVVTPSVALHDAAVPIYQYMMTRMGDFTDESSDIDAAWRVPQILIRESGTIFSK